MKTLNLSEMIKHGNLKESPINKFPYKQFKDNTFDLITGNCVFDSIYPRVRLAEFFEELHRITKPNGRVKVWSLYGSRYVNLLYSYSGVSFLLFFKLSKKKWEIMELRGKPHRYSISRFIPNIKISKHIGLRDYLSLYLNYFIAGLYSDLRVKKYSNDIHSNSNNCFT